MLQRQNFLYVKKHYHLPFLKRGIRVVVNGQRGHVTAGDGAYVRIRLEGYRYAGIYHPTWNIAYFTENGHLLADFRTGSQRR